MSLVKYFNDSAKLNLYASVMRVQCKGLRVSDLGGFPSDHLDKGPIFQLILNRSQLLAGSSDSQLNDGLGIGMFTAVILSVWSVWAQRSNLSIFLSFLYTFQDSDQMILEGLSFTVL